MRGDALASGDRSASFPPPNTAAPKPKVENYAPRQIFCECRDCPRVFYSAQEFCGHIVRGECTT